MVNMYLKDETSYALKQGWQQYRQDSYMLLPKVFRSGVLNFALYGCGLLALGYFLQGEAPDRFWAMPSWRGRADAM